MHIVAVAWIFVVLLMAAAEASSTQGTLLGALFTLLLYGALPLSIVLYVMGTPARRRARLAAEARAAELGVQPMARILGYAWNGVAPEIMGMGPVQAIRTGATACTLDTRLLVKTLRDHGAHLPSCPAQP